MAVSLALMATASAGAQSAREIRAVWVATQGGADWPRGRVTERVQRERMAHIVDMAADLNANMLIVQMQGRAGVAWRAAGLPLMRELNPTGSPTHTYDVAQAWIDECHRRGLDCVAWVTTLDGATGLDPADENTADTLMDTYRDLVYDYDIDGILFDKLYYSGAGDGAEDAAIRRGYLDDIADLLGGMVRMIRPDLPVYVAAPGIYHAVDGYDVATAYDTYAQDAVAWVEAGYADVVVPMMFHTERDGFTANVDEWASYADRVWIMPALTPEVSADATVFDTQLGYVQSLTDRFKGVAVYSARDLERTEMAGALREAWPAPAHMPYNPLGDSRAPDAPENVVTEYSGGRYLVTWDAVPVSGSAPAIKYYTVYQTDNDGHMNELLHAVTDTRLEFTAPGPDVRLAVSATDRYNRTSEIAEAQSAEDDIYGFDIRFDYNGGIAFIESSSDIRRVDIHTLMGRNVLSRKVDAPSVSVDMNGYERGIYVIRVMRDNRETRLYKVVI